MHFSVFEICHKCTNAIIVVDYTLYKLARCMNKVKLSRESLEGYYLSLV